MKNRLLSLNAERMDLDDLVELSTLARQYRAEYEHHNLEVPEWLDNAIRAVKREIDAKTADLRAMRIRDLKATIAANKSRADKLRDAEEELAKLEGRRPNIGEPVAAGE